MIRAIALAAALFATVAMAQNPKQYRAVVEIVGAEPEQWESAIGNVENLQKALGDVRIEVVVHGKGLPMLLKTNTAQAARLTKLAASGVTLAACENTMRRLKVEKSQLFDFVKTVDSGVAEIVRKQAAGWAYLKAGS